MFNVEMNKFYVAHSLHTHMQTLLFCYDMERTIYGSPEVVPDLKINIVPRSPEFIPKLLAYNEQNGLIEEVDAFAYQYFSEVRHDFLDQSIVYAFTVIAGAIAPWRKVLR